MRVDIIDRHFEIAQSLPHAPHRALAGRGNHVIAVGGGAIADNLGQNIGAARFGIIVAPEYEAEAIAIVRGMSGQANKARIIQGDKARKDMLIENGFRLPSAYDNRPLFFEEFESKIKQFVCISATP